jgi:Arc/MetJ-type ribon-helix-helix transcriptional regulator
MKVSVSLPDDDLAFLDEFARKAGLDSRSAAIHQAVRSLRAAELREAYAAAWEEFVTAGDAELWDGAVGDGLESA